MQAPFEISCVILCGGKSSRMGEDKALLPFSSYNSLTQYQYERLKPYFKNTYISSKISKFDFLDDENLILDEGEIYSPIVALQTIFKKLPNQKLFIITVDTPLVSIETISELIESSEDNEICVAQTEKTHNLCGVFLSSISSTIDEMLENDIHKVGYLLKKSQLNILDFPNDEEFINLNNKDEYKRALEIISNLNN